MAPAAEGNRPGSDKRPHSSKAVLQHHDSHAQPVDAVPRSPTKNGQKGTKQRPAEEARVPEGSPAKQAVPRKLNLPASIRAAKPGAEPNAKYLKQEAEARRKTMTASVSPMIKTIDSNYGLGSFVVLPGKCKFGTVKPGCVFETTLTMTNVGIDSTRYGVRQPKHPWLHVEYKPGPVAPGMNTKMVIKMTVPADATGGDGTQGPVQLADEFQIVSESEILHIPITAVLAGSTAKRG
ncbi:hypothetical protein BC831DRAFT_264334 [Entophlyctis helioformis]|nr:hypothetical protein BC831DRAFT_264334 [Entophlyctis helioformis]